jgi:hypothetical protein
MSVCVKVNEHASFDPRLRRLAELLGLADADHAIGRCFHVWLACLKRETHSLPGWVINQAMRHKGAVDALVACELAEKVTPAMVERKRLETLVVGEYRLKGTADNARQIRGGKMRAATANRVRSSKSRRMVFAG